MGTQFSRGLPKGGETVQVVRQVFQADLDFRAAAAFWRIPVQTFQLFPKDLPRDQHLQNIQPAPEFFQVIVPFIHEENSTFFVKKFFSHSNSLTWRSFYAKMLFVGESFVKNIVFRGCREKFKAKGVFTR